MGLHDGFLLLRHGQQVRHEVGRRETHARGADLRVGVLERRAQGLGVERVQAFQGPEGMEPGKGVGRTGGLQGLPQGRDRGSVARLDEQALGGVADPAGRMTEQVDARQRRGGHLDRGDLRGLLRHDAPDAAAVDGLLQLAVLDVRDEVVRQEALVLDDPAVHIDDVDRAVGAVDDLDRPETLVGRSQELLPGDGGGAFDDPILLREHDALHDVGGGLRDERIAAVGRTEEVAPVDDGAAGRGRLGQRAVGAQRIGVVAAVHARRRVDRVDRLVGDDGAVDARHVAQERIAREGRGGQQVRAQEVGIVVVVETAVVVLAEAILAAAEARATLPDAGVEAEARAVAGAPDPVVHRPGRRVGHVLGLAPAGAVVGRDDRAHIRDARPLGVLAEEEVRRLADEGAAVDGQHRARHHEALDEGRGLVHAARPLGILQQRDASVGLLLAGPIDVVHVTAHLDDEHPALVVEADRDGRLDHRLRGDELDAEALLELERLQLLLGGERRGRRQLELQRHLLRAGVAFVEGERRRRGQQASGGEPKCDGSLHGEWGLLEPVPSRGQMFPPVTCPAASYCRVS